MRSVHTPTTLRPVLLASCFVAIGAMCCITTLRASPAHDWANREAVLRALRPSLRIHQWRDDCDLIGAVWRDETPSPLTGEFRMFACAAGREWELPRLTVTRGQPPDHTFTIDHETLPGFLDAVRKDPRMSVVLRPTPATVAAGDCTREIWYPQIAVYWECY
jgi:hypothetical protein